MLEGILTGIATALTLQNVLWVAFGRLAGTLIGMLPGLGPISAIALMILFLLPRSDWRADHDGRRVLRCGFRRFNFFDLDQRPRGGQYGRHKLRRLSDGAKWLAGRALAIAAYASFFGGTVGAIILLVFASSLAAIALHIQSAEYAALVLFAMTCVVVFAQSGALSKSDYSAARIDVGYSGYRSHGRRPASDSRPARVIGWHSLCAIGDGDLRSGGSLSFSVG